MRKRVTREVQTLVWLISSAIATASTISLVTVTTVKSSVFLTAVQNSGSSSRRLILPAIEDEVAAAQLRQADLVEGYIARVDDGVGKHEAEADQGRHVHHEGERAGRHLALEPGPSGPGC